MNNPAIGELAKQLLELDDGELRPHEKEVIERAVKRLAVSRNVGVEFEQGRTFGQRLADHVAEVGGSWGFIIGFGAFIALWVVANAWALVRMGLGPFDPYPFIFLNLMLSLLAAVQAPIIMMSQNRQAAKDRLVAAHDYQVNLKAEIEIAALHEKLDAIRQQELAAMLSRLERTAESKAGG